MSDDETKDDALVPHQAQFLTNRSAALVQRGLAEALRPQSEIDRAKRTTLTSEEWQRVVKRMQKYLNAIRARRGAGTHTNDDPGTET